MRNIDTGLSYSAIQYAIDASETLDGHRIVIASGTYYENVIVNKSLSFVGEDRDTTIIDGRGKGTVLYITVNNVHVSNFTVQNGQDGIRLYHSKNSRLDRNKIYNNTWFGVDIDHSGNCTLRNNSIVENRYNFGVDGLSLFDFVNDIDVSNFVNGKPIYYLVNQRDFEIDSFTFQEIGYLGLVNSTDLSVKDLNLRDNIEGVLFAYTSNSTIKNVNVTNNWNGIYVKSCSNVSVSGNNAKNNFDYAIALRSSTNCTVAENNVNNNGWGGISLGSSWNCMVIGNDVSNNSYNIHLVESGNNLVYRNNAYTRNTGYSIALYRSNDNTIYHNNFVNSLFYTVAESRNVFDNTLEGNYWSSYNGTDENQDGIGDTPYVIGENNQDNYPLIGMFSDFEATLEYNVQAICNSSIFDFQFNGTAISFNVSGENHTTGFCRIRIQTALMNGTYKVFVNGTEAPHILLPCSNSTHSYLYFTYNHSTQKVVIISGLPLEEIPYPFWTQWWFWALITIGIVVLAGSVFLLKKRKPPTNPPLPPKGTDTHASQSKIFRRNCLKLVRAHSSSSFFLPRNVLL